MGRNRDFHKISPYIKEKVLAEYALTRNATYVAEKMQMTYKQVLKIVDSMQDDYNEIREQMKRQMVSEIWGGMIEAQKLGQQIIKQGLTGEKEIPLNHVSNWFGTMYDKQALLSGENTQNVGGDGIQVIFSMPDVAEDEERWKEDEPVNRLRENM